MYGYIIGKIKDIESNYVIIENNEIGYLIYVANPYYYKLDNKYTIYTYNCVREDEYSLYGFKDKEELNLFLKLISVKGLGPKMALPMFATGSINGIMDAINRENILYLKKFPKIGDKLARQIVLDLKGKFSSNGSGVIENNADSELAEALMALGYKQADIKRVVKSVDDTLSIENQIKEALKLLLK